MTTTPAPQRPSLPKVTDPVILRRAAVVVAGIRARQRAEAEAAKPTRRSRRSA